MIENETNKQEPKKVCHKCGEEKPVKNFSKNTNSPDRLQHECKQCQNDRKRELRNGYGVYGGAF